MAGEVNGNEWFNDLKNMPSASRFPSVLILAIEKLHLFVSCV